MIKTPDTIIVGATLEESAYHEAGHIVVAGLVGLPIKKHGLTVWEADNGASAGLADCEELNERWMDQLLVLRAGAWAEKKKFPNTSVASGARGDDSRIFDIVLKHFNSQWSDMDEKIETQVDILLDDHWDAVVAVAEAAIASPWKPLDADDDPKVREWFKRKKHLDGHTLAGIVKEHGSSAVVQAKAHRTLKKTEEGTLSAGKGGSIHLLPPLTDAELAVLGPRYPSEYKVEKITQFGYAHTCADGNHVPCPACDPGRGIDWGRR